MKTRTKRILLFTLIVACLAALVVFHSAAAYSDSPYYAQQEAAYFSNLQEYIEELPVKVVDHVVYLKANDGKSYTVISYFDTKEAMDTKRVVLQNEIDGIPVTRVQVGYDLGAEWDRMPPEARKVKFLTIPSNITYLGRYTFTCLPSLKSHKLPLTVVALDGAFEALENLTQVSLPAGVKVIGDGTFSQCTNLAAIKINGKVETIGDNAFGACKSLKKITLPDSVKTIGETAFTMSGLTKIQIPQSCTSIGDYAFNGCPLKYVTFSSVNHKKTVQIGEGAFQNCVNLKKVTFPENAKSVVLKNDAFNGCTALKAIVNPQVVREIRLGAFKDCAALETVTISSKIKQVAANAFEGCKNLKKVRLLTKKSAFLNSVYEEGNFTQNLPKACKVYVKTAAMKRAVADAGCTNKVIVKADLK